MKVALVLLALSVGSSAFALDRVVTVTGKCIRSTLPDRGAVTATADFVEQDVQLASKKAMDGYEKLKASVQKLGLKNLELSTSESSINEEREWQRDKSVFKGFRARMGLTVSTTDVTRLGEVISLAAKQGLRQVSGLSMFLSPEKEKTEREACLADAVANAKSKAESIAKSAGAKVGRIVAVTEGGMGAVMPPPHPRPEFKAARGAEMAADTMSVDSAPERLSVEVTATYLLE